MIIINLKTYKESSGESLDSLVSAVIEVPNPKGIEIILCPQSLHIPKVHNLGVPVWAQHIDPKKEGKTTGWLPPQSVKFEGASGTLLNHSEHKLATGELAESIKMCQEANLKTLAFADSVKEAQLLEGLGPNFIGYEPPELIASKETSVARTKPEVIESVVKAVSIPIIVGAGVKDRSDVEVSLQLGAVGVALSSAFVLAENPNSVLQNLLEGFSK